MVVVSGMTTETCALGEYITYHHWHHIHKTIHCFQLPLFIWSSCCEMAQNIPFTQPLIAIQSSTGAALNMAIFPWSFGLGALRVAFGLIRVAGSQTGTWLLSGWVNLKSAKLNWPSFLFGWNTTSSIPTSYNSKTEWQYCQKWLEMNE